MDGEARPSPAYYIALSLLAIGLLAGVSLFFLLTTRPGSSAASIDVSPPQPTQCAVGGHGTVCYRFTVSNTGSGSAFASCEVAPASGTEATFEEGVTVKPVNLLEGAARDLIINVIPDQSDTLAAPTLSCSVSSA
jgi:hypothetical protein